MILFAVQWHACTYAYCIVSERFSYPNTLQSQPVWISDFYCVTLFLMPLPFTPSPSLLLFLLFPPLSQFSHSFRIFHALTLAARSYALLSLSIAHTQSVTSCLLLHTHLYPPSQSVLLVIPCTCVAYMTSMTCWRMGKPSFSWQISSISRSLLK